MTLTPPPTRGEIIDAMQAEEDVPLVINGRLTEAGEFYVEDARRIGQAEA